MTVFATRVAGIPCQCHVLSYTAPLHGTLYDPPESSNFSYELLDRSGYHAKWLERKLTEKDDARLEEEFNDYMRDNY